MTQAPLVCRPIGYIRSSLQLKFDTPRQPDSTREEHHIIELLPGSHFEQALRDLEGFERIWLVWWFDRNPNWRPMVRPPRGSTHRRGVFATRSPHRPNPIGITSVPLLGINGLTLLVGSTDLLDNTPILDIKPYISEVDSFPNQKQGWLGEIGDQEPLQRFSVRVASEAERQLMWLKEQWDIDLLPRINEILSRSPAPSRRHRITAARDGVQRLSSGSWRVFFRVTEEVVDIDRVAPGFPLTLLTTEGREVIPHYQAQIAFETLWPTASPA
jgi:tRNA-Thr(GGU) m(6)t(6)A37 methyltransferase TsaA